MRGEIELQSPYRWFAFTIAVVPVVVITDSRNEWLRVFGNIYVLYRVKQHNFFFSQQSREDFMYLNFVCMAIFRFPKVPRGARRLQSVIEAYGPTPSVTRKRWRLHGGGREHADYLLAVLGRAHHCSGSDRLPETSVMRAPSTVFGQKHRRRLPRRTVRRASNRYSALASPPPPHHFRDTEFTYRTDRTGSEFFSATPEYHTSGTNRILISGHPAKINYGDTSGAGAGEVRSLFIWNFII